MRRHTPISRRRFLSLAALGGAGLGLAACTRATPTPPVLPSPTGASPAASGTASGAASAQVNTGQGYSIFHDTMADLTWQEVRQAAASGAIILLPVAVIEEHGPHLCLGTDTYITYWGCKQARATLVGLGIQALLAPPFYWGINKATGAFPGSFNVRKETFISVLYDIHASLASWGFAKVFDINLHGDSEQGMAVLETVQKVRTELKLDAYDVLPEYGLRNLGLKGDEPYIVVQKMPSIPANVSGGDVHAGTLETGQMVAHFPDTVRVDIARTLEPQGKFEPLGYWGAPAKFDAQSAGQFDEAYFKMTGEAIGEKIRKT